MPTLLRLLQLLAIVTWVGGLIFFAFVLAPTAFATYPTAHEAGLIVGASLRVFDLVGLACGPVFLLATAVLFARAPMRLRGRYEIQFLLAAIMLLATAYIHFNILPSMDRDRDRANGDITSVPTDHPARLHFDKLHKRSERVEGAVLLLGLAVVVLMSREQFPAEGEPAAP
jgi:uncharacterized membrane protein